VAVKPVMGRQTSQLFHLRSINYTV